LAGPDAPDRYKSDAPAQDSPDASASPASAAEELPEPADGLVISPPYRREEELRVVPAAALPDSAWPEDAAVARAIAAHWAGWFAAAEATECSAGSERKVAALLASCLDSPSTAEPSVHRPIQPAKAVSVLKESGPVSAQEPAWPVSPTRVPHPEQPPMKEQREPPGQG